MAGKTLKVRVLPVTARTISIRCTYLLVACDFVGEVRAKRVNEVLDVVWQG